MDKNEQLIIYTDGSSRGNPGKGGYGAILIWGSTIKEISKGYLHTTNNRMELMAVLAALELLKRDNLDIVIYSDSAYIVNSVEQKWIFGWAKKGFKGKKNQDLWKKFIDFYKKHRIKFVWVKGHSVNKWNNRCDYLATQAADGKYLIEDTGYKEGGIDE